MPLPTREQHLTLSPIGPTPKHEAVPSLSDAEAFRLDALKQKARLAFMRPEQRVFQPTEPLGSATDAEILGQRDLLLSEGELSKALPADAYFTRQFVPAFNQVNVPELIQKARSLRVL